LSKKEFGIPSWEWRAEKESETASYQPEVLNHTVDTHSKYFRIQRKDIAYFKFVIESYEGMAVVRTKDPLEAIVEVMIAPGWEKDVEAVLEGLRQEITIEPVSG
jgi:hypothetical protein